jgi:phosphate starvation-inducible PhoH-like protein
MSESTRDARGPAVAEHRIVVPAAVQMVGLLGARDELLRVVEESFPGTTIHVRGNEITVSGEPAEVALVERLVDELVVVLRTGQPLTAEAIERSVAMLRTGGFAAGPADVLTFNILSNRGRTIRPKTLNQKRYVDAIDQHTIVFGIGPAGTGKTYLAVAKAVQALQSKQVTRIILTRPAVEAGERLGFLPGTLYEKIDPYLRPLYDALHDMMDPDSIPRLMAAGTIEVAPLAFMRGRSLNDAFIILDEAQNTTPEQMKMFLTRLGFGSRMVVTGDVTQTDLPSGASSGLLQAQEVLSDIRDVAFLRLTSRWRTTSRLVSDIVEAYGRHDSEDAARARSQQGSQRRGGGRRGHGDRS